MFEKKKHDRLSLPSPGLYPREKPRHTESYAEHKVYNSLIDKLPEGWFAWHSEEYRGRPLDYWLTTDNEWSRGRT